MHTLTVSKKITCSQTKNSSLNIYVLYLYCHFSLKCWDWQLLLIGRLIVGIFSHWIERPPAVFERVRQFSILGTPKHEIYHILYNSHLSFGYIFFYLFMLCLSCLCGFSYLNVKSFVFMAKWNEETKNFLQVILVSPSK